MEKEYGKTVWFFPDGELPPPGEGEMKGHESIVILNPNSRDANVKITLYFTDLEPVENITATVRAKRVRCIRTNNPEHLCGFVLPLETQYAIKLSSDVPIIAQYGRLDNRQPNMAFYTTMGICE
ncbi:hypothetical protein DFR58_11031 [Anaerobacterium chartisolvens]|uniref:Sensory rhodopsin transducer n=1 Tax=Anaerobacterium chartisolvens TaxID=1297424 RepID=A0A369B7F7_9FIRM|nr:sensory rhodopsin transducer [Anaerobacterium chartisolvens]RCX16538.1 hypothetical protein DFR58_11031 [Anaerobacterium chartisolvens]